MTQETALTVYGTPWCQDCTRARRFLDGQGISYRWIDIVQDSQARQDVMRLNNGKAIIPTLVFPDGSVLVEPSDAALAQKLGLQEEASSDTYDLIVVGGGPAGLTAAFEVAQRGPSVLVLEGRSVGGNGGVILHTIAPPSFPDGIEPADYVASQAEKGGRLGVEILSTVPVTGIEDRGSSKVVHTATGAAYSARALVLSTGTDYRPLDVPGGDRFRQKGFHYSATCEGPFYQGQDILVIGGGSRAFQEALFLTQFARRVTIVEFNPQLASTEELQQQVREDPQIDVLTNTRVLELLGEERLHSARLKDRATDKEWEAPVAGAFAFVGLRPNTDLFRHAVALDPQGYIETQDNMETSLPGVFAAGSVRRGGAGGISGAETEGAAAASRILEYLGVAERAS